MKYSASWLSSEELKLISNNREILKTFVGRSFIKQEMELVLPKDVLQIICNQFTYLDNDTIFIPTTVDMVAFRRSQILESLLTLRKDWEQGSFFAVSECMKVVDSIFADINKRIKIDNELLIPLRMHKEIEELIINDSNDYLLLS